MDVKSLFALKKQKAKAQKEPVKQKPVKALSKKGGEQPSIAAGDGVGGSQAAVALKKKKAERGAEPPTKKQKAAGSDKQPTSNVVIVEDEGHASGPTPEFVNEAFFGREKVEAFVPKGSSILDTTLNPPAFMCQVMPSADRMALSRMDDNGLESKILLSSASNFIGLCEHLRRVEQMREARSAVDEEIASLRRKLAKAKDTLRLTTEGVEQRVQAANSEDAIAEAGEAAAEAAKIAAEEAEKVKAEEVAKAGRAAVEAFIAEGWMNGDKNDWVSSVVEKKVDAWGEGPGKMWLAERGDCYYQGGWPGISTSPPEQFDLKAYGLPLR
ncbi:unnamed protein product [Cuscuta europaea]|uniref:Uncharacterized protein n=1 Tax=Cuscuta europaea TaxID=41803 RepID=A0A9P0VWB2_CUSEU|nr:unnamed protein product [Cuscuta europaea]